jgi:hypothetical protein
MNIGQEITHMKMNVNYLANFIFIENVKNIKISLFSEEFKNSKNLFFFFLDLFFKGIVLLYGETSNKNSNFVKMSVELNNLNYEQIEIIKDKMKLAYIKLNLIYYHYSTIEEGNDTVKIKYKMSNIEELKKLNDNLNIKDYIFKLSIDNNIYNISFDIIHDI